MADPVEITSRLWKASRLMESGVFERLVRMACDQSDREFTEGLYAHVARQRQVVDAIKVYTVGSVDTSLESLAVTSGPLMDKTLLAIVQGYIPPPVQVGQVVGVAVQFDVVPGV